jgi:regulator of protease activity HflC (stomatin/prohibitin superfamily)
METKPPKAALISGAVVALIILFIITCFRVVGVGQVGIITQFGQVTREAQSGVVIKAPWPIQHITKMNIKTQKEQQDASAASKDLQTVTTTIALNYHLTPDTARKVFVEVGTNYSAVVIDPILQESIKSVTAQYDAAELIALRSKVEVALQDKLSSKLTDRGITVDNVSIVNFNFSDAFNQSIEQKQVAQQNAQKAQYELQTATTNAQAQDVQAKTLTPEYLELQAIQKWDGHMPATVAGGTGTILSIPLTK